MLIQVPIFIAPPDHTSCQSTPHLQDGDTSCQSSYQNGARAGTDKLPVNVEDSAEGLTEK